MATEPVAAATVVLVREGPDGPEVLLLHRNPASVVQGDVWVFPGGRIDAADGQARDRLAASRNCAVRETAEEAGLRLRPGDLIPHSRWVTPVQMRYRFDTWFFLAAHADGDAVQVDGSEIVAHRWCTAATALEDHQAGRRRLSPPGFVVLSQLVPFQDPVRMVQTVARSAPDYFTPRMFTLPDGLCHVYQDDAAFASGDLERPGPRHRLWLLSDGWRYEPRSGNGGAPERPAVKP